uniref:DNA damage-induced apoptosis suppressor protein isoform X2 n=1 Tax=Myxine glutinosa TaxID=7769 RepID=UPI0035902018
MCERRCALRGVVVVVRDALLQHRGCRMCGIFVHRETCTRCNLLCPPRHRLALQVACPPQLLPLTIYGTCLDPFFGCSAGDIYKQLGAERLESNPQAKAKLLGMLQLCFVGRHFLFAVRVPGSWQEDDLSGRWRVPGGCTVVAVDMWRAEAEPTAPTLLDCFAQADYPPETQHMMPVVPRHQEEEAAYENGLCTSVSLGQMSLSLSFGSTNDTSQIGPSSINIVREIDEKNGSKKTVEEEEGPEDLWFSNRSLSLWQCTGTENKSAALWRDEWKKEGCMRKERMHSAIQRFLKTEDKVIEESNNCSLSNWEELDQEEINIHDLEEVKLIMDGTQQKSRECENGKNAGLFANQMTKENEDKSSYCSSLLADMKTEIELTKESKRKRYEINVDKLVSGWSFSSSSELSHWMPDAHDTAVPCEDRRMGPTPMDCEMSTDASCSSLKGEPTGCVEVEFISGSSQSRRPEYFDSTPSAPLLIASTPVLCKPGLHRCAQAFPSYFDASADLFE